MSRAASGTARLTPGDQRRIRIGTHHTTGVINMKVETASLSHWPLQAGTSYVRPPELPKHVFLDSPATDVMTDFTYVRPRTIGALVAIDDALEHMRTSGVRLLLVTNAVEHVIGLVSSYDIQGEKPVRLVEEARAARSDITVAQIMTTLDQIRVLNMISVRNAQVTHVVSTLRELEHRHLLVCESEDGSESTPGLGEDLPPFATTAWEKSKAAPLRTAKQQVRGLFSAAQIGRQLGVDISEVMTAAHSLAEMTHELGHASPS